MEREHERMWEAVEGLTDEQLYYQPTSASNSIGCRSGTSAGPRKSSRGARFALTDEAHGMGHGPDDVASFAADRALLMEYAEAAHQAAMRRVRAASVESFANRPGGGRPAWQPRAGRRIAN